MKMPSQILISILGVILSVLIAIHDVQRGATLWSCFWFAMIVLHLAIIVDEVNKEKE